MSLIDINILLILIIIIGKMGDEIEIIEYYPDLGQCVYHFEDIISICVEKDCHNQKYLCRSCKPIHEGHRDIKNPAQIKELVQKLIKAQPKDKQVREEISKHLAHLVDLISELQNQVENATKILKTINANQLFLYYAAIRSTPAELNLYLKRCNLSENSQQIQKIANLISKLQVEHFEFAKQLPSYTENIKKNINIIGNSVQNLVANVTIINTMFDLTKITKKPNSTVPSSSINNSPSKNAQLMAFSLADKDYYAMQIIQQLKKVKTQNISKLNLYKNSIDSQGLRLILNNDSLRFPNLEQLNLKSNNLEENCLDVLLVSNLPKLKAINLTENFFELNESIINMLKQKWPDLTLLELAS